MKELQIIIKTPDDGNPLNQRYGRPAHKKAITVGWKMRVDDGKDYGSYYILPDITPKENLREAVLRAFDHAMTSEDMLKEEKDAEAL